MVRPAVSWAWLLAVVELAVAASVGVTTTVEATNDEGSQWVSNNGGSTAHPEQPSQSIPSWEELDARPLPSWYDQAKFGIFIHWGVFSVPSYGSEWFWYYWKDMQPDVYGAFVNATERPGFVYSEYATRFTAELYRPEQWAAALAQSGAQYVVLTSKHHEGFCTYGQFGRVGWFGGRPFLFLPYWKHACFRSAV